jgi:hypothetical protein
MQAWNTVGCDLPGSARIENWFQVATSHCRPSCVCASITTEIQERRLRCKAGSSSYHIPRETDISISTVESTHG